MKECNNVLAKLQDFHASLAPSRETHAAPAPASMCLAYAVCKINKKN
jgi:hypothetical protein